MTRILFVTQNYPYPGVTHGGGQDFWHLIDSLRHRHEVYVLTFDDPVRPVPESALRPYVADLHIIRYATNPLAKATVAARVIGEGYRFQMPRRVWEMRRLVSDWCARYQIDVLHCGWTDMGAFLNVSERPMVRVLDEVDIRFYTEAQAVRDGTLPAETARQRKAAELDYCRRADFVITRSEADKAILQAHVPALDVLVMPPVAHAAELLSTPVSDPTGHEILFVGAMNREPNQAAVRWFIQHVWPVVRRAFPLATLMIVGADPSPEIVQLGARPGVQVVGYVPDVCAWYRRARVVIAPMHTPSGQLNKIIDGLAAGRPVVATTLANRGTAAPCVLTADSPAEFANAVIRLLVDETCWAQVAAASRAFAKAHFRWSTDEMEGYYDKYRRAHGQASDD